MKKITTKTYLKWFQDMYFWRKFEDKCRSLYLKQKIRGFLHLYNGQEALPAGLTHAMDLSKDKIITAYRCHILPISMGVDPKIVMAELLGKKTGTSHGMGGSMHIFSKKHRFYGGHGIVGGQIPLGAGIAFADKYFNRKAVTLTLMGDGAVRQGSLHETFNMAMLWKLPVVFICENNQYAMGTSVKRSTNVEEIYKIGHSYGMPSYPVDGMDPEKIAKTAYTAIERARSGNGSTFLDVKTYRYRGHSIADSELYRSKEEIISYKKKDPILRLKNIIIQNKWATIERLNFIENEIKKEVESCVEFAEKSEFPSLKQMYNIVYHENNYPFLDEFKSS
ncbi:MAG: pyruvate dehydrogenase (acetyl-transferring) E1 component subunit alpha [Flavobacteriales bacterium]|jgi:pyruvate dehydrogenase E1 component alpha subunit|uniref:pyruvate dehydrogenase (acetyl-transferring) E1 component subunit alpha n=1 Tax=Blattabacterium sp. (Mastotermes darwiniensis) TaxID=39768 RepID=UPI000231DEEC|nr:pyruvate dehydrogenase (acetyl-transferring) E1 component subunit alpha [Blattabacterium sp. (Mastotermes darwiniensis)]AER40800.1 pyruvate dehydrogenase E1 component, alpha subunit [Blattabacterium sp. (Mastotermes darwiniensis) str. MADAR]MDR1804645.1 pyruvate dehydrogenase (acetyl-transferring) E1 component subunit alpha [Flavobacteriales bacterium]